MKKFILGLFLILGAISFAVPKNLNMNKINKAGYELSRQDDFSAIMNKMTDSEGISIAIFFEITEKNAAKELFNNVKETAPKVLKLVNSFENNEAYIAKYKGTDGPYFSYAFISKKLKSKDMYATVIYTTDKDLNGSELDKVVNRFFNQVESFLK